MSKDSEHSRCGEGVARGRPEQKDGENSKGVRAGAIAERPSGEAAEKGEGGQDPG